ncbi:unnamed protein product [Danaus chrysippus]|uniref:(African queen) hypothetical protein n=1 Tax=Danaus chrysippus TaxID=151541 RepID=A0A8J2QQF5_9NEOP|nr:unnamed protein product [Danaus chrysippus]
MSNTYESRRTVNPVQRGKPSSGIDTHSRRMNTGTRSQGRAYEYQQQRAAETDLPKRENSRSKPQNHVVQPSVVQDGKTDNRKRS